MQIVLTFDPACGMDGRKAALWAAAFDSQVREFCGRWGLTYIPVNYYSSDVLLKMTDAEIQKFAADSFLVTVQTTMDVPNALGFHDDIAGVIFARCLWQGDDTSVTVSHEILELLGDETCDIYIEMGDGSEQAKEACDRCEGDVYVETGTIDTDSMPVNVSDYLLLSAFVPGSKGPWDRMGRLTSWNQIRPGGYNIVRDASGNETDVFAARVVPGSVHAEKTIAEKKSRPETRLARRLAA